nr:MAG TPA: hypothetical protein [Caudoviricetes sp.]
MYFFIFRISFALSYGLIIRQYWRKVNRKKKIIIKNYTI